jgi:hypothetical protein
MEKHEGFNSGKFCETIKLADPDLLFRSTFSVDAKSALERVPTRSQSPRFQKQFSVEFEVFTLLPIGVALFAVRLELWRETDKRLLAELEEKFQAELDRSRAVSVNRMEK